MSVRLCSHRLSMQSDVLNDSNNGLSTDIDCSPTLPTTLIYSGLKLHPKPLVPTISMPSMANPLSIVKTLSLSDPHGDNSTKSLSTSPSIRLVTSTTGKSSPPTALQLQVVEKSTNPNGSYSTSKTFFFNHQQSSNSSSLVTLIPPGSTSSKIQTFLSSTNDFNNGNDFQHSNKSSPTTTTTTTASFLTKNRLTLVQPIVTTSSTSSSTSSSTTTSVTPKLVIQPNSTSNIWSPQSTTKILSAKMISHPVQLISSTEHSNENPLFTSKPSESSHSALIHMSVVPSASTESTSTVRLNNSRPMDHNNNHSISTEEKSSESNSMKNVHSTKLSMKNRTRLPLQPSSQQISSILPSTTKKQKLSNEEETSPLEPPRKMVHGESSMEKKIRKSRHRSSTMKTSIENAIPSSSSTGSTANESIPSKKRSSAELAAAAILSSSHLRKKRMFRKTSDEFTTNSIEDSSITPINDELMKTLSQDFVYEDQRTGIRWIATKSRSQPINTLSSRVSWKPKINHYEKYSDVIRMNSKRTVPIRSPETIRKKLMESSASWRIDRLTSYLTDLTDDEQRTQNALSDIGRSLTQLNIDDEQFRQNIDDLIEENLQRHRSFSEQLTQISSLLVQLMNHGNTLKEISSSNKTTPLSNSTRRTKER